MSHPCLLVRLIHIACGTNFIHNMPQESCTIVQRLFKAGAIILGKTTMHEFGLDVTNINPKTVTPTNPYLPGHVTGGSSGGSAAAVAAGFCPIAIGADGGGSIRIPASYCGLFGLKPTHGRISGHGGFGLAPTVGVYGPMTSSARDLALTYLAIAGPDPKDTQTLLQPTPSVEDFNKVDSLKDVKIGVYWDYFNDADPEIVEKCKECLEKLKGLGATIIPITISNLLDIRSGHQITILSELGSVTRQLEIKKASYPAQMMFNLIQNLQSYDFITSARMRTRGMNQIRELFKTVDVIVTPMTGITAPAIPPGATVYGRTDYAVSGRAMLYVALGNFLGIPGVSAPVGVDSKGLPIGIQFQAKWWEEAKLLRLAHTVEYLYAAQRPAPKVLYHPF